jgi:hypothetical protein
MKKLMFAAAVAAGLVAFGDGIESSNSVGYNTADFTGKTMVCVGVPFNSTGKTTFKLGDYTATGFDSSSDLLQTIDPDTADGVDFYVYLDAATYGESLAGWWTDDLSEQVNDLTFDAGTGFLGAFGAQEVVLKAKRCLACSMVRVRPWANVCFVHGSVRHCERWRLYVHAKPQFKPL